MCSFLLQQIFQNCFARIKIKVVVDREQLHALPVLRLGGGVYAVVRDGDAVAAVKRFDRGLRHANIRAPARHYDGVDLHLAQRFVQRRINETVEPVFVYNAVARRGLYLVDDLHAIGPGHHMIVPELQLRIVLIMPVADINARNAHPPRLGKELPELRENEMDTPAGERAALKETSLYTLANRCGIAPAEDFVQRFIDEDREVRTHGC